MKRINRLVTLLLVTFSISASAEGLFRDMSGNFQTFQQSLSKDKWTVVMIWAHDCHICNQEAEQYAFLDENDNIQVLGISIDGWVNRDAAETFISQHDLEFPNLITDYPGIQQFYRSAAKGNFVGTPTIMVYNPAGNLMAAQAGAVPAQTIQKFIADKSPD